MLNNYSHTSPITEPANGQGCVMLSAEQYYTLMSGVYQKQQEMQLQYEKAASLQAQKTQDEITVLEKKEKLVQGRMRFQQELESSFFEVILRDDGPYYRKVIGKNVLTEVHLCTTHELVVFYHVCKDAKEQPRVLEIRDKLHDDAIILVDPHIDSEHLLQGLNRWGVQLNVSRRNKKEVIDKLLYTLEKLSKEKIVSRNYGWNCTSEGVWYFEHDIKNTLEEVLAHE